MDRESLQVIKERHEDVCYPSPRNFSAQKVWLTTRIVKNFGFQFLQKHSR
jgi:hypothetical protein